MNKRLTLSLISLSLLSVGLGFSISNQENNSQVVKVEAETQYRSHKGRYLKNPLAVQTPNSQNYLEVIQRLYNAYEYSIDTTLTDSPFVREFKTYLANYQDDAFHPYALKSYRTNINTLSFNDNDVDRIDLTFEGTDDASEAITWMFAAVNEEKFVDYHESEFTRDIQVVRKNKLGEYVYVTVEDVKFKPVPAYNAGKDTYYPVAELNDTSGGAYIYLYYTTDSRVGYPVQEFKITYEEEQKTEHYFKENEYIRKVTSGDWEDCDFDHGVNNAYVYMNANRNVDALTVHLPEGTTRVDYFTRKYGNPHKYNPSECYRYPGYDCNFYFSDTYSKDYMLTDDSNTFLETDLYGRYEKKTTATKENQGNFFARFLMKINDESLIGSGSGKCITDGLYNVAKDGLINNLDNAGRKYIVDTYNDLSKSDSEISKAYKRMEAWANANGESFTIDSDGNISFSSKSILMVLINGSLSSSEIYTPSILFIGVSCLFVLLKLKKKKHK